MDIITVIAEWQDNNVRVDKFLATRLPALTRTRIQGIMDSQGLTLDAKIITSASHKVREGDVYTLTIPLITEAFPLPQTIPLTVIYEDCDLVVLNKSSGMVVHPAPGNRDATLVNALLFHCGGSLSGIGGVRRPGIVHRLDKNTSGLMVVAKNDFTHVALSAQFATRTLSRVYDAFVWGSPSPKEGIIEADIGRSPHNRQKMAVVSKGGKPAITHYTLQKRFFAKNDVSQVVSLVECHLQTGRTHQIRVHLSHIGHSLVGDPVYGRVPKWAKNTFSPLVIGFPRQALHAKQLTFHHPRLRETMTFDASLPADMQDLAAWLSD
jgi:23S rRNA pseudouridine1911/1915/1917 synthase